MGSTEFSNLHNTPAWPSLSDLIASFCSDESLGNHPNNTVIYHVFMSLLWWCYCFDYYLLFLVFLQTAFVEVCHIGVETHRCLSKSSEMLASWNTRRLFKLFCGGTNTVWLWRKRVHFRTLIFLSLFLQINESEPIMYISFVFDFHQPIFICPTNPPLSKAET